MRRQYPFHLIEPRWQRHWLQGRTFRAFDPGEQIPETHPFRRRHGRATAPTTADPYAPRYYALDMFPYPSGVGLHVGHPLGYIATDIVSRYKRMQGHHVLHPMGFDAFGLPAEQFAIEHGVHPRATTEANVANMVAQLKALGLSCDWERQLATTDVHYYRWTQWIFLKLYNAWFNPSSNKAEPIETYTGPDPDSVRLAYLGEMPVNWCPALGTVLANEEVTSEGLSERGNHPVYKRPLRQWMLRITAYAERLVAELDLVDWPQGIKLLQRNWIGRSEGATVRFEISALKLHLEVFTTRPDTLFGATFMVLAPEHPLVDQITTGPQRKTVALYRQACAAKSDQERQLAGEKTGVFTGGCALNPVNHESIPIWIADYVMMGYGTGAIMAVPAHDERDWEFAAKFNLEIRPVVQPPGGQPLSKAFTEDGVSIQSGLITGLPTPEARQKITEWLEAQGVGKKTVHYKLRDWLFSRQRYWGEPFPILHAPGGEILAVEEADLPVELPQMDDFKPLAGNSPNTLPQPPLARAPSSWKYVVRAGVHYTREFNTMPQWAGSCWYYLRFLDPANHQHYVDLDKEFYWLSPRGVDLYVGGVEHAVLHLLYARFWHKVLHDLGYANSPEPFRKLVNQGYIEAAAYQDERGFYVDAGKVVEKDGNFFCDDTPVTRAYGKMGKSLKNAVSPEDMCRQYGCDSLRLYEMFMGPLQQSKPWNTAGVEGVYRFLGRVWRLFTDESSVDAFEQKLTILGEDAAGAEDALREIRLHPLITNDPPSLVQLTLLHRTIKKLTDDLQTMSFNTAISALMVFVNEAMTWHNRPVSALREFLLLLAPFAPHIAEELWSMMGGETTLSYEPWPACDPRYLVEDEVEIVLQVNGKIRDRIRTTPSATEEELQTRALQNAKVQEFMAGKTIRKVIVVPGKLVNVVAG
ncbi:MAG: leucine--tRNA ligase [Verrucomicrobia bacterium]|nr:leucine--tRNA ligase [Verrucomicrobiota bacterium]